MATPSSDPARNAATRPPASRRARRAATTRTVSRQPRRVVARAPAGTRIAPAPPSELGEEGIGDPTREEVEALEHLELVEDRPADDRVRHGPHDEGHAPGPHPLQDRLLRQVQALAHE